MTFVSIDDATIAAWCIGGGANGSYGPEGSPGGVDGEDPTCTVTDDN